MALPTAGDIIDTTDVLQSFSCTLASGVSSTVRGYRIGNIAIISFGMYISTAKSYGDILFTIPFKAQQIWWASCTCINEGQKRHVYINANETYVRIGNAGASSGMWLAGQIVLPIYV